MNVPYYTSIDEKRLIYKDRYSCISTVNELDAWYQKNRKPISEGDIFRGVKEAKFKNYTSAQRFYFQHDYNNITPQLLIQKQIEHLAKEHFFLLNAYCMSWGIRQTDLFLLSFAQHYNGISPLLDFTHSIQHAFFFMSDECSFPNCGDSNSINNFASLYYLSPHTSTLVFSLSDAFEKMCKNFKNEIILKNCEEDYRHLEYKLLIQNTQFLSYQSLNDLSQNKPLFIESKNYAIDIENLTFHPQLVFCNLNIIAQMGCFIYNNRGITPLDDILTCVDIHKSLIPYIKEKYLQGITQDTIYPDARKLVSHSLSQTQIDIMCPINSICPI